jgi:uncharacterized membrane-anchored protein
VNWAAIRQTLLFILGIIVIIDALTQFHTTAAELIFGLILVGVVPIDFILSKNGKEKHRIQNSE